MNWIKRNFWEIHRSSSLAVFGGLLALGQFLTYFFWMKTLPTGDALSQPLLCWSFQDSCGASVISGSTLTGLIYFQMAWSALSMVLLFFRRSVGLAWFGIFFAWALHLLIYVQDASLRSNAQAFVFLVTFAYLFLPNKPAAIRYLFFSFFILDAFTKLNADWLSGLGFSDRLHLPPKGLEWAAAFSVIVQVVMPFFLLCRDGQRLGYGFIVLFVYQGFQFWVTKDPSHLTVALLLPAFVFHHFETRKIEIESMYQSYEHPEPTHFWWPVVVGLLVAAQFVPKHYLPQLELLTLEKIQTAEECQAVVFSYFDEKVTWVGPETVQKLPLSLKCNPQANFNSFKQYCNNKKTDPAFKNLTAFFLTRGMSEASFRVRFGSDRFCDTSYTASRIGGQSL